MNTPARPITRIDHDLLSVCRRIGEIGLQSELGMREPDIDALSWACEGLAAVLRERRAATAAKEATA